MAIKMKMNTSNAYAILVREAPAQQAGLEFFKNALEAVGSTFLTIRSIKIKSGFKAVFHNDGKGLDEKTMKDLAEVFGDPNIENGKTDENYNTGARLIGMKTNELGIVFISQHDGVIRSTRTFVRDGEALAEFDEPEYTTLFRREKRDWVRVVLLGNSWSQPTFRKPYGNLTGLEPFLEQFLFRFYSLGKRFRVMVNGKRFVPLAEQYKKATHSWSVTVGRGVTIHYRIVPNRTKAVMGMLVTNKQGLKELFDVHYNAGSSKFAKSSMKLLGELGAYAMKKELSIIVELDSTFDAKQTQYRDKLINDAGNPVELVDFHKMIVDYVPTDLKQIIDERSDRANDKELKSKTTEVIKEVMEELGLDLERLVAQKNGQYTTGKKEQKKRDNKKSNPNPGPSSSPKGEPTPAEKEKGVPQLTAEFNTEDEQWEKHDIGVFRGTIVYFNPDNPFVKRACEQVIAKIGGSVERDTIAKKYIEYVAGEAILALAYIDEDTPDEVSKSTLLSLCSVIDSTGSFVDTFVKNLKKG